LICSNSTPNIRARNSNKPGQSVRAHTPACRLTGQSAVYASSGADKARARLAARYTVGARRGRWPRGRMSYIRGNAQDLAPGGTPQHAPDCRHTGDNNGMIYIWRARVPHMLPRRQSSRVGWYNEQWNAALAPFVSSCARARGGTAAASWTAHHQAASNNGVRPVASRLKTQRAARNTR
jgi:hypothetical protein